MFGTGFETAVVLALAAIGFIELIRQIIDKSYYVVGMLVGYAIFGAAASQAPSVSLSLTQGLFIGLAAGGIMTALRFLRGDKEEEQPVLG